MRDTGIVERYSRQFDEKLNAAMKQRIDYFALQVANHVYFERPTHAQIDPAVVGDTVELEFRADSCSERGPIRRVETNHVRYGSPDLAKRLLDQRIHVARTKVMEYGIPINAEKAPGNIIYLLPESLAVPDIDRALLSDIFTGSHIMHAVGSEIPEVLKKEKLSKLDLVAVAHAYGYTTRDSALEKIRMFYERLMNQPIPDTD